jgi:hypothetical protein
MIDVPTFHHIGDPDAHFFTRLSRGRSVSPTGAAEGADSLVVGSHGRLELPDSHHHVTNHMRLLPLATLLLVTVTACWDVKHPREMVGTWAQDTLYGGITRRTDTLRLRRDGIALHSGSIAATDLATNPSKPVVWAEGLKWAFRPRAEGHLLCLFVDERQEPDCHTVRVASESVLVVDGNSYRRLPGR